MSFLDNIQYIDSASITNLYVTSLIATGSLNGTSSWSNNSLTTSYYNGSIISASYSLSSSYSSNGGGLSLTTGSTYPITSSWALSSISNSYSNSSSYSLSSSYGISASYAINSNFSISASWTSSSLSSSYATNATTASQGLKAWAAMSVAGTTLTSKTYGCSMTRGSTGVYYTALSPVASSTPYSVVFCGWSGSTAASATHSVANVYNQATNGFTMSIYKVTPYVLADFNSGSIIVQSY